MQTIRALTLVFLFLSFVAGGNSFAQNLSMRRANTVGNWSALENNNGILFNQTDAQHFLQAGTGGFWLTPDNQLDTVIFGGGLWFGGLRKIGGTLLPHVEYAYEPNHVGSEFVPGSIIYDGSPIDSSQPARDKYRVYRSTDVVGPAWPIRTVAGKAAYIDDPQMRTNAGHPMTIGDEDLFAIYKDSDPTASLDSFSDPFGFEVRTQMGFWRSGLLKDVVVVESQVINTSRDTIFEPVIAIALDGDIQNPNDDRLKEVRNEAVSTAVFFTDGSTTDPLLGVMQLAGIHGTDRVNAGLTALRYWDIEQDPKTDSERYAFLTDPRKDTALSRIGDARVLISSLSHTPIKPGDTVYYDFAVYARGTSGKPALSPDDSSAMLNLGQEIYVRYLKGKLGASAVRPAMDAFSVVYPNPASSILSINTMEGESSAVLIDVLGRKVALAKVAGGRVEFDVRGIPTGRYTMSIIESGRVAPVLIEH